MGRRQDTQFRYFVPKGEECPSASGQFKRIKLAQENSAGLAAMLTSGLSDPEDQGLDLKSAHAPCHRERTVDQKWQKVAVLTSNIQLTTELGLTWQIVILGNKVEMIAKWMHEMKGHFRPPQDLQLAAEDLLSS